ncbi:MAG: glucosamine 6-phosphate synthetase [Burkholderiales bacterium]|nr:glucosamine 6-phosphate synthetase [Burkholderiales bacterium]MCA3161981.1 glucosamine 6-phosphate synthetase [Burkholderiales bacterium]MCA3164903.1 glucosamine 6-phosphate synthetase [Burkholderiales bacterium]MCA3169458.1 glucosamine 6-phosphate synthetase [Burkholderiales bacterium]MCA3171519.1 glucosamine 6-phosphate synthetase [Burkholderiales bacterium]
MCGIFGIISQAPIIEQELELLARHAQQRGRDSSGLLLWRQDHYQVYRAEYPITQLLGELGTLAVNMAVGHSRLITNGLGDNQPVLRDDMAVLHNGIVVNHADLWIQLGTRPALQIDSEVIPAIAHGHLTAGASLETLPARIFELCQGVVACVLIIPKLGKMCLLSNNGSLYVGEKGTAIYFSSERYPLTQLGCNAVRQIKQTASWLDIPTSPAKMMVFDRRARQLDLIPSLSLSGAAEEEGMLQYRRHELRRCTKCLLPETMPYIRFDAQGVCNYCHHYKPRNKPRPKEELFGLVEPFRRKNGDDCIVPFSGGRDSCYGLHLIVKELKMKPITYTYDWGMVTDLGRRNISRMSAQLGVENIIVADDIALKRRNIAKNFTAWLKSPHLGMVSILTAGDKHFFRHIETIKRQTGISLNLWGVNPLEVTHFKAGFLGVPPDFEEERVYSHGALKQLRYQWLRFKAMLQSPGYFNSSLWDTLSGEYYRSFHKKSDYYHIFDYWRWDEKTIDDVLFSEYDWERAPDTKTTWRIGDGTAAIYNYIYYTIAGFTEHDTFRSNQIREGDLTREEALELVMEENRPRYPNIKWYLDAIGIDFKQAIKTINSVQSMY